MLQRKTVLLGRGWRVEFVKAGSRWGSGVAYGDSRWCLGAAEGVSLAGAFRAIGVPRFLASAAVPNLGALTLIAYSAYYVVYTVGLSFTL